MLVLGMHRSGTSALTKTLNLLGAALPARLLQALPVNPRGFFEPEHIVGVHDRLLASAGSSWSDWAQFPRSWYGSHQREDFVDELARAVEEDFGTSRLFVLKDPRICRFVPLWLAILDEIGAEPVIALPYRNPVEVATSLAVRDGFPLVQGYLLWLRHLLDAEHDSRGCPRAFLRYEDLVGDPRPTIDRLMSTLPVVWPRQSARAFHEVETFVDRSLRRNVASPEALVSRSDISDWVRDTYAAYGRLESDPEDRGARERLDEIRAAFDRAAGVFSAAFQGAAIQLEREAEKAAQAEAELAAARPRLAEAELAAAREVELTAELEGMRQRLAEAELGAARAAELTAELGKTRPRLAEAELGAARAAELTAELEGMRRQLAEVEPQAAQAQGLRGELEAARQHLTEAESRALRMTDLEQELGASRQSLARLEEDARRCDDLEGELRTALHELDARTAQVRHLDERIARLRASLRERASETTRPARAHGIVELAYQALTFRSSRKRRSVDRSAARMALVASSGFLDAEWYLDAYPDVEAAGIDPLRHFVAFGSAEGRSPGPKFDALSYLTRYPDVRAAGAEPLFHYLAAGEKEGRTPLPS